MVNYIDSLSTYMNKCADTITTVEGIKNNTILDMTLTSCELFDLNFKKELILVDQKENNKSIFPRNNYKGKTKAGYLAQMFYLIITTSESYNFDVVKKVTAKIVKVANRRKYPESKILTEVVENENQYFIKMTEGTKEPLNFKIKDKQTYVTSLAYLATVCVNTTANKMVHDFYETYLQNEIMKMEEGVEPTAYVEWGKGIHLNEYFEPVKKVEPEKEVVEVVEKSVPKHSMSDIDIERYRNITTIDEEMMENKKRLKPEIKTVIDKEDEFYRSTFVTPMGMRKTQVKR